MSTPEEATEAEIRSWRGVNPRKSDDDSEAEDSGRETTGDAAAGDTGSRKLLGSLLAPHKGPTILLLILAVVEQLCLLAGPLLIGLAIDKALPDSRRGDHTTLTIIAAAYLVAGAGAAAAKTAFLRLAGRIGQDVLLDLRRRIFDHGQRLSLDFHERYTSGRLISRATSDVDALRQMLDMGLDGLAAALLTVVFSTVVLVFLDVPMTLIVIAGFIPVALTVRWYRTRSRKAYRRTRTTTAALIVQFVESVNGIRAVQAFRREPRNQRVFATLNRRSAEATADTMLLFAKFVPTVRLAGSLTVLAVLIVGAYRTAGGGLALGVLASFLIYLRRMYDPLDQLAMFLNTYESATAALEKISGLLNETPGVAEPEKGTELPAPERNGRTVTFQQVSFGYNAETTVLHPFDLTIPAGQTVAVVGTTGAGKSTLAKLLARFYDPTDGSVLLDGVNIRDLKTPALRREVTMITQESFLFSGSVADNIALGRPDATRDEIEAVTKEIGAYEFIAALPEGFDTDVRKRGGRLSSGQRQLVAFARALLADPAVLILDEATSSLDVPGERAVQHALATVLNGRTAVIIAHRLSTVEIADRVLVVDGGRIVEDGPPKELMAVESQFSGLHEAWQETLT